MSITNILFGALFVLMAFAVYMIVRIEMRLKRLFKGSAAQNLEGLIADIGERLHKLDLTADNHQAMLKALADRLQKQGHGIKLVRFNPFKEVGGSHSFAVAIVNEDGDGVVFSSLYSRERMSVFAKPVMDGKSDVELTPEEAAVVEDARKEASN